MVGLSLSDVQKNRPIKQLPIVVIGLLGGGGGDGNGGCGSSGSGRSSSSSSVIVIISQTM